jgi:translation initiation factor 3 subunit F
LRETCTCSHSDLDLCETLTIRSNNHIQDVLVVSYLANTIRTQIDLSNRLATAALLTPGASDGLGADDSKKDGQQQQKRGGGNQRNRQPREPREQ